MLRSGKNKQIRASFTCPELTNLSINNEHTEKNLAKLHTKEAETKAEAVQQEP